MKFLFSKEEKFSSNELLDEINELSRLDSVEREFKNTDASILVVRSIRIQTLSSKSNSNFIQEPRFEIKVAS